jgi:hypothetical protein
MTMSSGIVCKVWNIQGVSAAKGTKQQLSDSVGYILNDEKTTKILEMNPLSQLERECKYVENDIKTFSGAYVGGFNVSSTDIGNAVSEMMQVKEFYGKKDGRAALHMMISLPVEESDIKNAPKLMQLCNDVISELFPNNQAIFAVHTNTDNLHIHAIINSVGLDGKKIHQDKNFVKKVLQPCVNKYAKKYGLSANEKWKEDKKSGVENESVYTYPQLKIMLRKVVDRAIEESDTFEHFTALLKSYGIDIRIGKHISLKLPFMKKPIRTSSLGGNYTRDSIVERIATKREKLPSLDMGDYSISVEPDDVYIVYFTGMKKYKDMSEGEKKDVIQKLRLGRNPWRENKQLSWQLNSIADDINTPNRIKTYTEFYSKDGTLQGALDGILEAKKQVAHDKKMIAYAKNKYKPIIDIYNEMKSIETRAFLYEYNKSPDYRNEFIKYRSLTRRLKKYYNKEVFEVSAFLQECDERTLYARAQLNELSAEYREIKRYGFKIGEFKMENNDLISVLEYYSNRDNERMGSFEANAFYITDSNANIMLKVVKSAANEDGTLYEKYDIMVMDVNGNVVEELSNIGNKPDFGQKLNDLQEKYGLEDCHKFGSRNEAEKFCAKLAQNAERDKNDSQKKARNLK